MPNHKSADKRARQNVKRKLRNMAIRSTVRTVVKKTRETISEGKKDEAQTALKAASKALLSSVSKGVSHKNSAARKQSRLALQVNKLGK